MEISYKTRDLESKGFLVLERCARDYMGFEGSGFYVLAKETIPGEFQIHAATDIRGNQYDESDINGETFDKHTLDQFLQYLQEPIKNKEAA